MLESVVVVDVFVPVEDDPHAEQITIASKASVSFVIKVIWATVVALLSN
jgi:hypothetical protein